MFEAKTWKDRITEYPTRRTLTKEDGTTEIVTVARNEGTVSEAGDAFSAENMNDLEQRVVDGFEALTENLEWKIPYNLSPDFNFSDSSVPIGSTYIANSEQMSATGSPETGYPLTFGQSATRNATLFIGIKNNIPSAYIRTHKHKSIHRYRVSTYKELTGTLVAGETTITLTDDAITTNSAFDFLTSIYGVSPISAPIVTDGSITLEFDAQETDMNVEVRVM